MDFILARSRDQVDAIECKFSIDSPASMANSKSEPLAKTARSGIIS